METRYQLGQPVVLTREPRKKQPKWYIAEVRYCKSYESYGLRAPDVSFNEVYFLLDIEPIYTEFSDSFAEMLFAQFVAENPSFLEDVRADRLMMTTESMATQYLALCKDYPRITPGINWLVDMYRHFYGE